MKIRSKFLLWFLVVAIIPLLVVQIFIFTNLTEDLTERFVEDLHNQNEKTIIEFKEDIKRYVDLSLSLTELPPIYGMYRAKNTGIDPVDEDTLSTWENRLAQIFISFMKTDPAIDQLRFIDINGEEKVRVNNKDFGQEIVKKEKLQNKSNRYYFKEGILTEDGGVYISNLDLNVENGVIEVPEKPVFRYVSPAYVEEELTGLIVIVVKELDFLKSLDKRTIVLDEKGNYIFYNNQFFSVANINARNYFEESNLGENNEFLTDSIRGGFFNKVKRSHLFWEKIPIDFNYERYLIVLTSDTESNIKSLVLGFQSNILIISLIAIFISLIISTFISRNISNPIEALSELTEKFSRNEFVAIPEILKNRKNRDEITELFESFKVMSQRIREYYTKLETKIKQKTEDLKEALGATEVQNEELQKNKVAIMNILEDVQRERLKTEALKSRLEIATKAANLGVFEWDIKNDSLKANEYTYKIFDFPKDLTVGASKLWLSRIHEEDRKEAEKHLRSSLSGKTPFDKIFRVVHKNGNIRFVRTVARVTKDKANQPVSLVGVNIDVTHEKEVDRAKTEFVSLASHQLRTPLSAISWYSEMLMNGDAGELSPEQKKYLGEVYRGNQRMISLVNALLNVSRLDLGTFSVQPKEIDLIEVANTVLNELSPKISAKKHNIIKDFDESVKIMADPNLSNILIQNLCSNSIKYTPDGGNIKVSIKTMKTGQEVIDKVLEKDSVVICVSDNGLGIPESQQDKIFSKLFRADNVRQTDAEGTGLGLYIIKSIIENVGGNIWFKSKQNEGSQFCITIPVSGMVQKQGTRKLEI